MYVIKGYITYDYLLPMIHHLGPRPAALGSVNQVETCTSVYLSNNVSMFHVGPTNVP